MKNIFLLFGAVLAFTACSDNGSSAVEVQPTISLDSYAKKSGFIKSYDINGTEIIDSSVKDDGYYQEGLASNYTRASDIVSDEVTGLMWQDDIEANSTKKEFLTGENLAGCIDGNQTRCDDTSGDTATTYCSGLSLGGYTDWRVPKVSELLGILEYADIKYSANSVFVNMDLAEYVSSTTLSSDDSLVWMVDFSNSGMHYVPKNNAVNVRCVRDSNTSTVLSLHHLEWQHISSDELKDWSEAIDYCETLDLDGAGWRVPNINELNSIVDYSSSDTTLVNDFKDVTGEYYWSSTSHVGVNRYAWGVDFSDAKQLSYDKSSKHRVRCVRSGI